MILLPSSAGRNSNLERPRDGRTERGELWKACAGARPGPSSWVRAGVLYWPSCDRAPGGAAGWAGRVGHGALLDGQTPAEVAGPRTESARRFNAKIDVGQRDRGGGKPRRYH